jgi:hypothetical protein
VIPFLFVYGEKQNKENLKNRSLEFLEQLPSEENSIIEKWEKWVWNRGRHLKVRRSFSLKINTVNGKNV